MSALPTGILTAEQVSRLIGEREGTAKALDPFRDFECVRVPMSALPPAERERLEAKAARHSDAPPTTVTRYRVKRHLLAPSLFDATADNLGI